tara:strand:+ start:1777 stop:4650 length:2874 start_codon:yes stop_codon:yes gene_type:complete
MKRFFQSIVFFLSLVTFGQNNNATGPSYIGTVTSMEYVTSLASRAQDLIPSDDSQREIMDKRSIAQYMNRQQLPEHNDPLVEQRHEMEQSIRMTPPSLVFDAYASSAQPTDPSLAIGPNHVFVVFNTGFIVYDKQGTALTEQASPSPAIFPNGGCCDLTVSYDNAADRWVLSFLGNGAQIAVSDGPDPINSGWFIYTISTISDYQKLSVWSDGYYLTDNTGSANKVWALDRNALLNGNPNAEVLAFNLPGIQTSGFYSPQVLNVTDDNLPAAGGATVIYMQDDAWSGVSYDHIKLWTIDVNWTAPSNSQVSSATEFSTAPFVGVFDNGSFSNLQQPGRGRKVSIDALQATIMNQAQFRKFSTHNSAVFNFVVDTDGSSAKVAGVRWHEFRQNGDNQPWTLFQEGTYTAPDNRHAWNASIAMDGQGNIGMGYTSMSSESSLSRNVFASSFFTGRMANDPLNVMTGQEETIELGNNKIPGTRYGDYSKIDVDPADDTSFWFITEYYRDSRRGVVGKFQIQSNTGPDEEAPSIPSNLSVTDISETSATLNWSASTDNIGVALYNIFLDEVLIGTTPSTTYNFTGLNPETQYLASVSAEDAAGNTSGEAMTNFTTLIVDTQAPTSPTNLSASDITSNSARLDWTESTDNVGVALYNISINGVLIGSSPIESFDVTGLSPLTSYSASVTAEDAAGNESAPVTTAFETIEGNTGGGLIAAYYFESGWQGWIDGGRDCQLQATSNSCEGVNSIRLRNGSNSANAVSPVLDLSANAELTFEFDVYASGMSSGDDFFVDLFDGTNWNVIGQYMSGTDFQNGECFTNSIVLSAGAYNFNTDNRFRIRNSGNKNNDLIWFDQVIITGDAAPLVGTDKNLTSSSTQAKILTGSNSIRLYPNPARTVLNINTGDVQFDEIMLFSTSGALIKEQILEHSTLTFDVSTLPSGLYFVRFVKNKLAVTKRFIKQ